MIRQRLRELPEAGDVLVTAALLGRELDVDALCAVVDMPADAVLDHLAPALTSGLLAPVNGNASRLRFSHELVREALEDELQAGELVRRHRAVAEALERFYGSRLERHLAEIAYHFASAGHDPRTVGFARRAAESSARQLAFEEAARLYELALRAADANGIAEPGDRAALLLALGDAWARAGQSSNAKSAFVEAADVGRAGDLRDVVVKAALGFALSGRTLWERAATTAALSRSWKTLCSRWARTTAPCACRCSRGSRPRCGGRTSSDVSVRARRRWRWRAGSATPRARVCPHRQGARGLAATDDRGGRMPR